jgi:antitoxin HicB
MADVAQTAREYLRRPYSRVLVQDPESRTFMARVLEFPGCVTQGDSAAEALARLDDVAANWIVAALDADQAIPTPVEEQEFNGRILLRVPKSLHRAAMQQAEQEGVSLNQFLLYAISEKLGLLRDSPAPTSEERRRRGVG